MKKRSYLVELVVVQLLVEQQHSKTNKNRNKTK